MGDFQKLQVWQLLLAHFKEVQEISANCLTSLTTNKTELFRESLFLEQKTKRALRKFLTRVVVKAEELTVTCEKTLTSEMESYLKLFKQQAKKAQTLDLLREAWQEYLSAMSFLFRTKEDDKEGITLEEVKRQIKMFFKSEEIEETLTKIISILSTLSKELAKTLSSDQITPVELKELVEGYWLVVTYLLDSLEDSKKKTSLKTI